MKGAFTFIGLIFIFLSINSYAQVSDGPRMLQQITAYGYENYYLQYDKSPYLTREWSVADITVLSGEVYKDIRIKYDLYKGHIVYYNAQLKKQLIIDNEIITSIQFKAVNDIGKKQLINYCTTDTVHRAKCQFYFSLVTDSIALWSKMDKKVNIYTDVSSGYGKLGEYYLRVKYYLVVDDHFIHLPQNRRSFLKLYPENKKELAQFIRKKRLSFKNQEHLIWIIKKLNELEKAK